MAIKRKLVIKRLDPETVSIQISPLINDDKIEIMQEFRDAITKQIGQSKPEEIERGKALLKESIKKR